MVLENFRVFFELLLAQDTMFIGLGLNFCRNILWKHTFPKSIHLLYLFTIFTILHEFKLKKRALLLLGVLDGVELLVNYSSYSSSSSYSTTRKRGALLYILKSVKLHKLNINGIFFLQRIIHIFGFSQFFK